MAENQKQQNVDAIRSSWIRWLMKSSDKQVVKFHQQILDILKKEQGSEWEALPLVTPNTRKTEGDRRFWRHTACGEVLYASEETDDGPVVFDASLHHESGYVTLGGPCPICGDPLTRATIVPIA